MNITARFKRLTLWNKLSAIGSIVGIIAFVGSLYLWIFADPTPDKIIIEYPSLTSAQIDQLADRLSGPAIPVLLEIAALLTALAHPNHLVH